MQTLLINRRTYLYTDSKMKQVFVISGMSCAACAAHVEKAAATLAGVTRAQVSLLQNTLETEYNEDIVHATDIMAAVERAGYQARLQTPDLITEPQQAALQEASALKRRFIHSLVLLLPLMAVGMSGMWWADGKMFWSRHMHGFIWVQLVLSLPVLWINGAFFSRGLRALKKRLPTMDTLVALGSGAAIFSGVLQLLRAHPSMNDLYFESAAMIVTLVTLGKWLEARAKAKTAASLTALASLLPVYATVRRGKKEETVLCSSLREEDVLIVRAGMRFAADGIIINGAGAVDESALTGESIPQDKLQGAAVTAGTLLVSGYAEVKIEHVAENTRLAQMIELVKTAAAGKAPIAVMADRVSAVFVPVVLIIALITLVGWWIVAGFSVALPLAISVLVISCPCALGLATPTALMVGLGRAAKEGILVKSAAALERAGRVNTVVLDKTGTVTTAQMQVAKICPATGIEEQELLTASATLEQYAQHPFATALLDYARKHQVPLYQAGEFQLIAGKGVKATAGSSTLYGGNSDWFAELKIRIPSAPDILARAAAKGCTPVFFAQGKRFLGSIWFSDTIKPTSAVAVKLLQQLGLEIILLTGDNEQTAGQVADEVGIKKIYAHVLPQEKESVIRRLQREGNCVAMVGDGINDAPALVRADVGMAMGSGTDIAAESADIVLLRGDLCAVATALSLSRAVLRNIKQNLFWAFFYNILGIPLAAGVLAGYKLNPLFAAAAMSISSVCVVSNALRLRLFQPPQPVQNEENKTMHKTLVIEGMVCGHCAAHVERALNALEGVQAKVNLDNKTAVVQSAQEVSDDILRKAVQDAGYEVVAIY